MNSDLHLEQFSITLRLQKSAMQDDGERDLARICAERAKALREKQNAETVAVFGRHLDG